VARIKGSGAHLTVDQCSARSLVTRSPSRHPQHSRDRGPRIRPVPHQRRGRSIPRAETTGSARPRSSGPASCCPAINGLPGKQRTSFAPGRQAAAPEAGAPPLERAAGGGKAPYARSWAPRGRRPLPVTGRAPRPVDFADTGEVLSRPNRAFEGTLAARKGGFSARERGETACFGAVPQSGSPPGGRPIQPPGAPIASIETGKSLGQRSIYYIWRWKSRPGSRVCVRSRPIPACADRALAGNRDRSVQQRPTSLERPRGRHRSRPSRFLLRLPVAAG